MQNRFVIAMFLVIIGLFSVVSTYHLTAATEKKVYVIPVEQTVERGLEAFLERSLAEAVENHADHVILEIDTPGGAVDAASNIASIIRNTPTPVTAFVVNEALSAGAYISLNADEIAMAPGTEMGAAQVIDGSGNAAEDKVHSAWVANMMSAAELNGRNPLYAQAMADPEIDLEEYRAGKGKLLSFTASEAYEVGYAEYLVDNREELLIELGLEEANVQELEVSFSEHIARFVTHPVVIPILLSVGSLGIVLELYSPGFGVPGIMGISALLLFFFGHLIAGFAGMEAMVLFVVGMILLIIELFVPGFGIFGVLGIGSMIGSMILASYSTIHIVVSILIAAVITIVVAMMMFKTFGMKGPMKRLVLTESLTTKEGFVSHETKENIVGKRGKAVTPLRPSGTIMIGKERLDAVSEGDYIREGEQIEIIAVEGARTIVRALVEKNK